MEEKDAFYVVRKGDIIGVYKSFSDCQDQAGSSVCNPSMSVYKGYCLPKEAEEFLDSHGLKNATYSIRAGDVTDDLFGKLVACPLQATCGIMEVFQRKNFKLENSIEAQLISSNNCAMLWTHAFLSSMELQKEILDNLVQEQYCVRKMEVWRLREGVGFATNNVAEYRAVILGLRYALMKGFKHICVQGDSKLVCMQIQGLWKIKNQNMADLCKEARELKDKFVSFQIDHVLRGSNSEADAQANLAINLKDGQVEEDRDKK